MDFFFFSFPRFSGNQMMFGGELVCIWVGEKMGKSWAVVGRGGSLVSMARNC